MGIIPAGWLKRDRDVLLTSPADGDAIIYNASAGKWENGPAGGSGAMKYAALHGSSAASGSGDSNWVAGGAFFYNSDPDVFTLGTGIVVTAGVYQATVNLLNGSGGTYDGPSTWTVFAHNDAHDVTWEGGVCSTDFEAAGAPELAATAAATINAPTGADIYVTVTPRTTAGAVNADIWLTVLKLS